MRGFVAAALLVLFSLPAAAQQAGSGLTRLADAPPAPDFSLLDMDGAVYRLSDYRGRAGLELVIDSALIARTACLSGCGSDGDSSLASAIAPHRISGRELRAGIPAAMH